MNWLFNFFDRIIAGSLLRQWLITSGVLIVFVFLCLALVESCIYIDAHEGVPATLQNMEARCMARGAAYPVVCKIGDGRHAVFCRDGLGSMWRCDYGGSKIDECYLWVPSAWYFDKAVGK